MFFGKRRLIGNIALLCLSLNTPIAQAYQEYEDDGWSEFNAQMLNAAKQAYNNDTELPVARPHPKAPPRQPVTEYQEIREKQRPKEIVIVSKEKVIIPKERVIISKERVIIPKEQVVITQKKVHKPVLWFFKSYVTTLSTGLAWENAGQTQTFNLTPAIRKTYDANNPINTLADGELFVGVDRYLNPQLQGQIGLALAITSNAELSGNIWDDADPLFNNYIYSYKVQHSHIAVKGKLLTDTAYYDIKPYVSASLGVGFNRAENFTNTPLIFEAIVNPDFASNTTTTFTYTLGFGIQRAITDNWQAGIGYEFASWGRSQLGRALGQSLNEGLELSQLYTNGIFLSMTYTS